MPRVSQRRSNFPQLGGEMEVSHVHTRAGVPKYKASGRPELSKSFPYVDLSAPATRRSALVNFTHSITSAPSETVEFGEHWYPRVHEATMKGITGRGSRGFLSSHGSDRSLAAAGLVAAVSPNMDWDRNNIAAMSEMRGLGQHHWDAIMAAKGGSSRSARASQAEARNAVAGMSLASAPIPNLQKAGRIVAGEHPDTVLDPRTAPKTNNFMHNIHDPSGGHVTIDGRAFDTLTNRVRPWEANRGIGSSALPSGATTRYEHARDLVSTVAHGMGLDPSAAQAISWSHTKYNVERAGGRSQGRSRLGQPYFHPQTGEPVSHSEEHVRRWQHLSGQFS